MALFDWAHNPGSTRPRVGMAALSFRERTGLRRLTNTEHQCSEYLTPRRSLSVRFATPAIPGRSEKLLSESGSRPARGLEPVRRRFGSASVVPFMAVNGTTSLGQPHSRYSDRNTDTNLLVVQASGKFSMYAPVLPGRSHCSAGRA